MNKIVGLSAAALAISVCTGCKVGSNSDWQGAYLYEHDSGETPNGATQIVEYNLILGKPDTCRLIITDLQSEQNLICAFSRADKIITIDFTSAVSAETGKQIQNPPYPVGEPLFTLENESGNFMTRWQSLKPEGLESDFGYYFVKRHQTEPQSVE